MDLYVTFKFSLTMVNKNLIRLSRHIAPIPLAWGEF